MVMGYSKGTIVGNVGRDPEMRYLPSGVAVCNFSVAVNRKRREEETVNWWKVVMFGATAENADRLVTKGTPILVDGEMHLSYWTGQDGVERHQLEIVGGNFVLLGYAPGSEGEAEAKADPYAIPEDELDDVPF